MSSRWNFAGFDSGENAAIRFGSVQTVAKSTAPFERDFESRKEARGFEYIDVDRDEVLEARCVDEKSPARKRMQSRSGRSVTTLLAALIERGHPKVQIWNERIQQRTLAYARWPDECTELSARQSFGDLFDAFAGRGRYTMDRTRSAVDLAKTIGQVLASLEIEFVHDHDRLDPGRTSDDESAIDVAGRFTRFRCDHDAEDIEVDSDRAIPSTVVLSAQDSMSGLHDQAFAKHDHSISRDRPLFRSQPDLALSTAIKTDEHSNTMMRDHSTRFTAAKFFEFGLTLRSIDPTRLSSTVRRRSLFASRHSSIHPEKLTETRISGHPALDRVAQDILVRMDAESLACPSHPGIEQFSRHQS
jgi:hypothetical protein